MKKLYTWAAMLAFAALTLSCSETLQRRYDRMHGTSSSTDRSSRDAADDRNYQSDGVYRKDYDRTTDNTSTGSATTLYSGSDDYNRNLLNQYAEMDKLGEVVLYELDNLENRYNNMLNEYRNAKSSSRQAMAMELDKISDDRLVLYKAYTNIYRNGKTDWQNVRRDVDNTLREIRKKN